MNYYHCNSQVCQTSTYEVKNEGIVLQTDVQEPKLDQNIVEMPNRFLGVVSSFTFRGCLVRGV